MKRSKFSLSNTKLLSCNMGDLIPIGLTEVLPGDTVQHATSLLLRCSPLLAPVMHPVDVRVHHWYVPIRLIWDDWEDFITGGPDGNDTSEPPYFQLSGGVSWPVGSLADYLGLPPLVPNIRSSSLPFRAYNMIWNEYYRDQDLQQPVFFSTASGLDSSTVSVLQRVGWEKDYFTSARPWEQKGPSITIPLGTSAPVVGLGVQSGTFGVSGQSVIETTGPTTYPNSKNVDPSAIDGRLYVRGSSGGPNGLPEIYADLTGASAVTVNLLREALALQRFEEARARFGSRYVEYLRYLGVRSSDSRLQRPEYLGGGRQTIQFSEVIQTAEGSDPVGELRGHGIAGVRSRRYRRFFEEHGFVLSLMSVRPKTIYMQGIPRLFNRRTKEDYWQRELQHIGQQEVYNRELYAAHSNPDDVFGYQDRYDEYRRQESTVAGEFRTSLLDHWHFARNFSNDPALNASFVTCTPTERTFAVPSQDVLYVMARHSIQARRLVAATGKSYIF